MFDYEDFSEGRVKEKDWWIITLNKNNMKKKISRPDAETGTTTALDNLVSEVNSLNEKMEQAIIRVVKENGGEKNEG